MKKKILIIVAAIIVVSFFAALWINQQSQPGKLDAFAQCLKENDAVFYGTFWCSYCQSQKKMFGRSAKYLPYVECSTSDGRGQLATCKDKKIEGYPAWEFSDGSRLSGAISLTQLSEKTGCQLPQ
ncbi:MAG: vitamin K epoxide reductase [Parcubacteria group bacterium Licking1014_1]|nr:MAG: vitamin K epoxide reductase [Parcubacteria group bacterium Licking1014_1]